MDKKNIIIISVSVLAGILIIGLLVGGYFYLRKSKNSDTPNSTAEEITNSATQGVLPSLQTNPLENKPDINPAAAANPIKNIKTNPF